MAYGRNWFIFSDIIFSGHRRIYSYAFAETNIKDMSQHSASDVKIPTYYIQ